MLFLYPSLPQFERDDKERAKEKEKEKIRGIDDGEKKGMGRVRLVGRGDEEEVRSGRVGSETRAAQKWEGGKGVMGMVDGPRIRAQATVTWGHGAQAGENLERER